MRADILSLPGPVLLTPDAYRDARGWFLETYQAERYAALGVPGHFVQDNHSRSVHGVLRGLHYQLRRPQAKLVQVIRGAVFDVAVDVRRNSPDFGHWCGAVLDDQDHRQLYVPAGFAHGFLVLSEEADVVYKCSDFYQPGDEFGIAWNDPDIAIEWPQPVDPRLLSDKDRLAPRLREAQVPD